MTSRNTHLAPVLLCLAAFLQGCESTPVEPAEPPPSEAPVQQPPPEPPIVTPAPEPEPIPVPEPPAPVEEPPEEPSEPVVCEPPPQPKPSGPARPETVLPIFGGVEYVTIDPPGYSMKARIDTGATTSSLDARDIREFERDGKSWVKFLVVDRRNGRNVEISRPVIRSANLTGGGRRYVVSLKARIGGIDQFTEFSLADRSSYNYPVLIGRNFLRDQALVDVARRFTIKNPNK